MTTNQSAEETGGLTMVVVLAALGSVGFRTTVELRLGASDPPRIRQERDGSEGALGAPLRGRQVRA